jgi:hypothetical protein
MTSIKPLQNPQRRNRELTMINVKRTFRPSSVMKNPFLFVVGVLAMNGGPVDSTAAYHGWRRGTSRM